MTNQSSALRKLYSVEPEIQGWELAQHIVHMCGEVKGKDICALNISKLMCVADYFVVVSARSDRQVQGIANKIMDSLEAYGVEPYSTEGIEQGQWAVLDFGDVVAHIFYEPVREHYDIEGLWAQAEKVAYIP